MNDSHKKQGGGGRNRKIDEICIKFTGISGQAANGAYDERPIEIQARNSREEEIRTETGSIG